MIRTALRRSLPLTGVTLVLLSARPAFAQNTAATSELLEAIDLYTGVSGIVDDERARELLEGAAADSSDVLARMWIARVHSTGRMTFPRDQALARSIAASVIDDLRALADRGDVEAIFLMGTAYDEGLGYAVDHPAAMGWYLRAAARGHVLAAHNVGNMHRDGRGVPASMAEATIWWLQAAQAGDVIPALRLGEAYEAGNGVPRDLDAARHWYGVAAAAGNAAAAEALERLGGT